MNVVALTSLLLLTLFASPALAYLDPGSGSMLVAGLVGLLASVLFFLKGLYYKSRRAVLSSIGRTSHDHAAQHRLVFYSEGRQYWSTFRPLIDELARRQEPVLYLTSDEQDPGLLYATELMETKCIGTGTKAYASLAVLEADLCVMTTPGLDVLQIKRSRGVKHYTYLTHAPTDMGTYKKYAFDYFDSMILSGDHQLRSIRKLEELRRSPTKQLHKLGCLYYDELQRQLTELDAQRLESDRFTVLVAPTWGENGLLKKFGLRLLSQLLDKGWTIIVRPHPQSYTSEAGLLEELKDRTKRYTTIQWDSERDPLRSMAQAQAIVSDLSGIVFDFVFLFERPAITISYPLNKAGQEASDLPWDVWELSVLDRVGARIDEKELDRLPAIIESEVRKSDRRDDIRLLRQEAVINFGHAAKDVVSELLHIRDQQKQPATS